MIKRIAGLIGAALAAIVIVACTVAGASDKPPAIKSMGKLTTSSIDTLGVFAKWTASSVPKPQGPITYTVVWRRNTVQVRSVTITALTDTVRITPRANPGGADSVRVTVTAVYQGRNSGSSTLLVVFPNVDNQVPSVPGIIQVDSL